MFPDASQEFASIVMVIGAISVIYGGILAWSQKDPKALIAYATLSHAGLLLIGVFCKSRGAFFGVPFLMSCQALSTGGVLMLLSHLYGKEATIDLHGLGGFLRRAPQFSAFLLIFLLAGMGAPVFGNFVGEWLILWGAFQENLWITVAASLGIILGAIYSLWLFQRLCFGKRIHDVKDPSVSKFRPSELAIYSCITIILLVLGFYPGLIFEEIAPSSFSEIAPLAGADESQPLIRVRP